MDVKREIKAFSARLSTIRELARVLDIPVENLHSFTLKFTADEVVRVECEYFLDKDRFDVFTNKMEEVTKEGVA